MAGDLRTAARGDWLYDRIFEPGSVVLSAVGGDAAGTAAAHRHLGSPHADAAQIPRALGARTARLRTPHPAGSLAWLSWIVARHGGWTVAGQPPGPKSMARGWQRFAAALTGALLAQATVEPNPCRP